MAEPACLSNGAAHQSGADAAVTAGGGNRDRSEQQSWLAAGAGGMPQPRGANDAFALGGDEGQPFGRQPAIAQALRALAITGLAEGLVEQRFARFDVGLTFVTQCDHLRGLPSPARRRARTQVIRCEGKGRQGKPASRIVQMW